MLEGRFTNGDAAVSEGLSMLLNDQPDFFNRSLSLHFTAPIAESKPDSLVPVVISHSCYLGKRGKNFPSQGVPLEYMLPILRLLLASQYINYEGEISVVVSPALALSSLDEKYADDVWQVTATQWAVLQRLDLLLEKVQSPVRLKVLLDSKLQTTEAYRSIMEGDDEITSYRGQRDALIAAVLLGSGKLNPVLLRCLSSDALEVDRYSRATSFFSGGRKEILGHAQEDDALGDDCPIDKRQLGILFGPVPRDFRGKPVNPMVVKDEEAKQRVLLTPGTNVHKLFGSLCTQKTRPAFEGLRWSLQVTKLLQTLLPDQLPVKSQLWRDETRLCNSVQISTTKTLQSGETKLMNAQRKVVQDQARHIASLLVPSAKDVRTAMQAVRM